MMFDKKRRYRLPSTVDEAAELLISDLMTQHLHKLTELTDENFDLLCEKVTPYMIDEFQIWEGNQALLTSCMNQIEEDKDDPVRVILDCVVKKLQNINGVIVIT